MGGNRPVQSVSSKGFFLDKLSGRFTVSKLDHVMCKNMASLCKLADNDQYLTRVLKWSVERLSKYLWPKSL